MELTLAFVLYLGSTVLLLALGKSMLWPLAVGFVLFSALALRRGHSPREVGKMVVKSIPNSLIVVAVILLIGCLTGLWRLSGTIAYFVTLGVSLIPPRFFLLAAFLLASAMSYALGTSFGVTATAGVILMSIARAGDVNPMLAAGAIISGVYVGDRGSPAASSASLVAAVTKTDLRENVRVMLRTSIAAFGVCVVLYGVLSLFCPMEKSDPAVLIELGAEFRLGWVCLIPAVLMILLPFCRMPVKWAMAVSILVSAAISVFWQGNSLRSCVRAMLAGYTAKNPALEEVLSGGGVVSMLEVSGILLLSGAMGGVLQGAELLRPLHSRIGKLSGRIGRFPTMLLLSVAVCAVFCNQTIGIIMLGQLSGALYRADEKKAWMSDIENSVVTVAGLVPWCIASAVPRAMLGASAASIPMSAFLWLVPLWTLLAGKRRKSAEKH